MGKLIYGSSTKWEKIPSINIKASLIDADTDRYIYIRSRIITCDEANGNGDFLPKAEVIKVRTDGKKTWETFIGTMIDYNHDTSIELGKCIDANFIDEKDGELAYVELIGKIDRKAPIRFTRDQQQFYATLIARIEANDLDKMSMEAYAENARCNYCKTTFPFAQPCDHVANYMNAKIKAADGTEFHVCREDLDVTFVGSGIVENPADRNAEFSNMLANKKKIEAKKLLPGTISELPSEAQKKLENDEIPLLTKSGGKLSDFGDKALIYRVWYHNHEKGTEDGCSEYFTIEEAKDGAKRLKKTEEKVEAPIAVVWDDKIDDFREVVVVEKMTAKEALENISGLELMKIIDALDNGDDRVNQVVSQLSASITEPIFEEELKIDKRLTAMEMNKIKVKLIEQDKLIDKSLNAQLIKLNGKDTWLIMKNALPAMKRTLDEIWGEDINAEGTIDGMTISEYAKSDLFKRRMLLTYQKEGQEYLERIWSKQTDDTMKTVEEILKIESKDYEKLWKSYGGDFNKCVKKAGEWASSPEGYCADLEKKATGKWPAQKASMIEASQDEFKACINANRTNKDIVAADGITQDEAIEAFCFKKVIGIQASYVPRLNDIFENDLKLDSVVGGEANFKAWLKYKGTGKFPTISAERIQIKLFAKALKNLSDDDKDILVKASNLMKYGFGVEDVKKYHILASELDIKKLQKYDMEISSMRELFSQRFGV